MEHIQNDLAAVTASAQLGDTVLVSVIIPAFNAANTIIRAIDSVRQQNVGPIEIIVIDDGSADRTLDVVRDNIADGENIQVLRMQQNSGVSAARNTGIRVAQGKYLAFLDADDIWLPAKLQKQIARMEEDPTITLVSCNSRLISESGVPLKEGHRNRPPVEGTAAWKTLLIYNFIPTPTVLTRTAVVKALGGFDVSLAVGEDLDLWIKLGIQGRIAILPDILINYYDLAGSLMKRHSDRTATIVLPMLEKHIAAQRQQLTRQEIRTIRGQRSFQMACDMFFAGAYLPSVPIFLKAAYLGTRPIKSLLYVPRAACMALLGGARRRLARSAP
jgi:glycosyltransferase involved in cell wall biosynthesis